jgi:Protein of unknown function (DUF952)
MLDLVEWSASSSSRSTPRRSGQLKWEPSRGGALFPHLYGPLQLTAVHWVKSLRLDPDGWHVFRSWRTGGAPASAECAP